MELAVKEKIARIIGRYFTTDGIVSVFTEANVVADRSLFAKWKITLDAFGKMSGPDVAIPHILEVFCHPLNFPDPQVRENFIQELNVALAYDDLKIKSTDKTTKIVSADGRPIGGWSSDAPKTSTDFVVEAISFFKNEYNRVRIAGLTYEYPIGENIDSHQVGDGRVGYEERVKAIEQLKNVGFVTEYRIEPREEGDGMFVWDYALCKINESRITQKEAPPATEAGVRDLVHKIAITAMPELVVRNAEDNTLTKGKKRIRLPKFGPTDWAKITIRFLDERNVLINADKKEQVVSDYEALGFADERRGKPNLAWKFLYELAQNNGETKPLPTPIPDSIKQQKRQLSDRLRAIFKNEMDPFSDPTETRTYRIKINLVPPQSEGEESDRYGTRQYLKETMTQEYEG